MFSEERRHLLSLVCREIVSDDVDLHRAVFCVPLVHHIHGIVVRVLSAVDNLEIALLGFSHDLPRYRAPMATTRSRAGIGSGSDFVAGDNSILTARAHTDGLLTQSESPASPW
jgi:hypothetical protein